MSRISIKPFDAEIFISYKNGEDFYCNINADKSRSKVCDHSPQTKVILNEFLVEKKKAQNSDIDRIKSADLKIRNHFESMGIYDIKTPIKNTAAGLQIKIKFPKHVLVENIDKLKKIFEKNGRALPIKHKSVYSVIDTDNFIGCKLRCRITPKIFSYRGARANHGYVCKFLEII